MQASKNAISATPVDSDMTDVTPAPTTTRLLVRKGTSGTIQDYFKSASPSGSSDMDTIPYSTEADMSSNLSSPAPEHKKYKITAYNGRELSLRQPEKKRIKREATLEHLEEGSQTLRRKTKRAKLANLPDVPLDALFEIFSHLLPLDILHLARTTKALRSTLLHRSATSVWKASLLNVPDLPPCPEDLSIPFYVNLLFDSHCHNCLINNVSKVDFNLRVRYCSKCVKLKLVPLIDPKDQKLSEKLRHLVERLVPSGITYASNGDPLCTVVAKEVFIRELKEMKKGDAERMTYIHKQKEIFKARKRHAHLCSSWKRAQVKKRTREISDIKTTRNEMIRANLTQLGYEVELDYLDNMAKYICAIYPRPDIPFFDRHPDVNQSKPLTDRVWSNIKPSMIEYMEEVKILVAKDARIRLLRSRRAIIHAAYIKWRIVPSHLQEYPSHLLMPGPADIMDWLPIKTLINKEGVGELEINQVSAQFDISNLDYFTKYWRECRLRDLWTKITSSANIWDTINNCIRYSISCHHLPKFKLAVVVFRCGNPHWGLEDKWAANHGIPLDANGHNPLQSQETCMWYPEFIFHPCNSIMHIRYSETIAGVEHKTLSVSKEYKGYRRCEWTWEHLHFDDRASRTVKNILEACGLDWEKVTVEDMDKRNDRFVCLKCTFGAKCDGERKVRVWSWRDAVHHSLKTHFGDTRVKWEHISQSDASQAILLEILQRGYILPGSERLWKCILCRDTESERGRMSWDELQDHFADATSHEDGSVVEDLFGKEEKLYYKALDYAPRELPPFKMCPKKRCAD